MCREIESLKATIKQNKKDYAGLYWDWEQTKTENVYLHNRTNSQRLKINALTKTIREAVSKLEN